MIDRGRRSVLGVQINAVDYETVVERVAEAANDRRALGISALAVHGLMEGRADAALRYRLNALDLVVPDGQPVRWALNWLHGTKLSDRVRGPSLTLKILERAARDGHGVFFYGSTPAVLDALRASLCERWPDLRIVGMEPSKFRRTTPDEKGQIVERIRSTGAQIVFVGLGCPRQEVWVYEYAEELSVPTLAVGAAFDFHAGLTAQAPEWMQRRGLEWVHRLAQDPRRLWKRYLKLNPLFLFLVLLQLLRLRRFEGGESAPAQELLFG